MKGSKIDWVAAKTAYVNDATLTLRQIAERFGASETSVHNRSARESWTSDRVLKAEMLATQATKLAIDAAAVELAKWNEQDLLIAKAMRNQVAKKLQVAAKQQAANADFSMDTRDLRVVALVAESAQRMARLALGAGTMNTVQAMSPQSLFDDLDLEGLSDDELAMFQRLVAKTVRRKPPETIQ